jgi:hypothetical protein
MVQRFERNEQMKFRISMMIPKSPGLFLMGLSLVFMGCGPKEEAAAPHPHEEHAEGEEHSHGHSHAHTAPHGGTLVILGDHFAIVEVVLDAAVGKMTAYVLDGEAEKPVRISQPAIEILILKPGSSTSGPPQRDLVKLEAVANPLTGEKSGDTSEFSTVSEVLKGKDHFDGIIQSVTLKGEEKKGVSFKFPEGNE